MHLAVKSSDSSVSLPLLRHKANIEATNNKGRTPLHEAAHRGEVYAIQILFKAQANINAADNKGNTPLHIAAKKCHIDAVKYLLNQGANRSLTNKERKKPYDLVPNRQAELKQLLYPIECYHSQVVIF